MGLRTLQCVRLRNIAGGPRAVSGRGTHNRILSQKRKSCLGQAMSWDRQPTSGSLASSLFRTPKVTVLGHSRGRGRGCFCLPSSAMGIHFTSLSRLFVPNVGPNGDKGRVDRCNLWSIEIMPRTLLDGHEHRRPTGLRPNSAAEHVKWHVED